MNALSDPKIILNLEVYSDAICPWCYIGKRRLEKAQRILGERYELRVIWRPFELNPSMPREGMDRKAYRSAKFGSWAKSQALDAEVAKEGASEGLTFAHAKIERTPNTFDSHRLVWLAGTQGKQDTVVEAIFRAYFVQGKDIGDRSVLVGRAALRSQRQICNFGCGRRVCARRHVESEWASQRNRVSCLHRPKPAPHSQRMWSGNGRCFSKTQTYKIWGLFRYSQNPKLKK